MFETSDALHDLVQKLLLAALVLFVVNCVLLAVATWGLSRLARRRGRRGHRLPAFVLALAGEVALVTTALADPVDSTIILWFVASVAVMALALSRLWARQIYGGTNRVNAVSSATMPTSSRRYKSSNPVSATTRSAR